MTNECVSKNIFKNGANMSLELLTQKHMFYTPIGRLEKQPHPLVGIKLKTHRICVKKTSVEKTSVDIFKYSKCTVPMPTMNLGSGYCSQLYPINWLMPSPPRRSSKYR